VVVVVVVVTGSVDTGFGGGMVSVVTVGANALA
jgi:hypothetical protein